MPARTMAGTIEEAAQQPMADILATLRGTEARRHAAISVLRNKNGCSKYDRHSWQSTLLLRYGQRGYQWSVVLNPHRRSVRRADVFQNTSRSLCSVLGARRLARGVAVAAQPPRGAAANEWPTPDPTLHR